MFGKPVRHTYGHVKSAVEYTICYVLRKEIKVENIIFKAKEIDEIFLKKEESGEKKRKPKLGAYPGRGTL